MRFTAGRLGRSLFPHFCVACGSEGSILCAACLPELSAQMTGVFLCPTCGAESPNGRACVSCGGQSALDGVISAAPYARPALRELLHLYKYESVAEAGDAVASLFRSFVSRCRPAVEMSCRGSVILDVPLHPIRLALRGFNQAAVLSSALRETFGTMNGDGILGRRLRFRRQVQTTTRDERLKNAKGSVVLQKRLLRASRFVLVDDVFTTGATLNDCAHVLKKAGAGEVWGVTFLRG